MSSTSSTSPAIVHSVIRDFYYRRLLLHTPLYKQPTQLNPSWTGLGGSEPDSGRPVSSLDANVVMILAVLLCALICALGLNSIVRCALRCSNPMAVEPETDPVALRFAQTGKRRKALRDLPTLVYSAGLKLDGANTECAICLSDFVPGERVRFLPKCNHGFHVRCVDRWLIARSSCPTCRQCLFCSNPKTSDCAEVNQPGRAPVQEVLVPLEPEGLITSY
ncbi:RING-H2 finger protein ATL78-like [Phoenix dactylifera]|uniref:RING-H2 finger protein ATL78-like n=1 Tax=Phoenix dactylifera TaxID=42345 RepID=A0A8B7BSC3_PHODC|nr:RING-H2 finger protein ATL78-like [Phoenix dactylifera]